VNDQTLYFSILFSAMGNVISVSKHI